MLDFISQGAEGLIPRICEVFQWIFVKKDWIKQSCQMYNNCTMYFRGCTVEWVKTAMTRQNLKLKLGKVLWNHWYIFPFIRMHVHSEVLYFIILLFLTPDNLAHQRRVLVFIGFMCFKSFYEWNTFLGKSWITYNCGKITCFFAQLLRDL